MKKLSIVLLVFTTMVLAGCATSMPATIATSVPSIVDHTPVVLPLVPNRVEFLQSQGPAINKAMTHYEKSGHAEVIETNQMIQYPFGFITPTITCSPLHTCDVTLAAEEKITGIYPGDTTRWAFETAVSGMRMEQYMHVIFKPKNDDIATNAIITTTERTYHIGLKSKMDVITKPVSFYYPDKIESQWSELHQTALQAFKQAKLDEQSAKKVFNPKQLSFAYRISTSFWNKPTWTPLRAFNDGIHVYLQMPNAASTTTLPTLFVLDSEGKEHLTNYRVKKPYYIIDELFQHAVLKSGVGQQQQRVSITAQN